MCSIEVTMDFTGFYECIFSLFFEEFFLTNEIVMLSMDFTCPWIPSSVADTELEYFWI